MSGIAGILGLQDTDNVFINTIGQSVVFQAATTYLEEVNNDTRTAMAIFVEETTEQYKERYYLPGGGRLDRRGGQAQSSATKATGSWDVAYPLEDFGKQIAGDDVALAYLTVAQFQRHLDTIQIQNINTVRYEMLKCLFNNTARTFVDPLKGSLTIQPLAISTDNVTYPPVLGSEDEATETHLIESGYAASSISDTNNPLVTIRDELEEHFGAGTGGEPVVVFINNAQTAKIKALSDFDEVIDFRIRPGASINIPEVLTTVPSSARVLGVGSGVWVVEWRWIPSGYAFGMHLGAPAPLKMRVDPAATGLPRGLNLVARDDRYPLEAAHYRHRFGFGVGNRLNGVTMEFGTGGTYTIPSSPDYS